MTERASCWSVTINNPSDMDDDDITMANATTGWKVTGQLEKGENGTEHYQLMVRTPQVRFSAVKKAFPRAHIEVARNPADLAKYVTKTDTRIGALPNSDWYPSQAAFYTLICDVVRNESKKATLPSDTEVLAMMQGKSKDPLEQFDRAVKTLIAQGYHCEHHGCNPQVRSAWRLYRDSMLTRYDLELHQKIEAQAIKDASRGHPEDEEREEVQSDSDDEETEGSDEDSEDSSEGSGSGSERD